MKTQTLADILFQSILQKDSLEQILKKAANFLGNPIIIFDAFYFIVASSPKEDILDKEWYKAVDTSVCSPEFISELPNIRYLHTAEDTKECYEVACRHSPYRKLVAPIQQEQGGDLSAITIACKNPFPEDIHDQMTLLSKTLALYFREESFHADKIITEEDLYFNRLDEQNIAPARIKRRFEKLNYTLAKDCDTYVLLFNLQDNKQQMGAENDKSDAINFMRKIKEIFQRVIFLYYKYNLLTFLDQRELEKIDKLQNLLRESHFKCAISRPCNNYERVSFAYEECKQAMLLGPYLTDSYFYRYDDLHFYKSLFMIHPLDGLNEYKHPIISRLEKIDEGGTAYYDTLRIYLEEEKSLQNTADRLYIHRNTVYARVKKLENLLDLDLQDNRLCNRLKTSFKLYHFFRKRLDDLKQIQPDPASNPGSTNLDTQAFYSNYFMTIPPDETRSSLF